MATPYNLSFNHTAPSTSQQSLQTPDASSLLLHDATTKHNSTSKQEGRGFQSLEELLNDAGVITVDTNSPPRDTAQSNSNKRSLPDPEFSTPTKKLKGEENTSEMGVSAGLTSHHYSVVPSILSSSTNYHTPVSLFQSNTLKQSTIPLVNPAAPPTMNNHLTASSLTLANNLTPSSVLLAKNLTPLSISSANNLTPSLVSLSNNLTPSSVSLSNNLTPSVSLPNNLTPSSVSLANNLTPSSVSLASVLGSQPPLALGSISLLVQLYKQFQSQGNVQGMQKIKDQLTHLQSQLIAKSKNLSGQTGLTGTINITPTSTNTSAAFQPVLVPTQASTLNGPSIVTNGVMNTSKPTSISTATPTVVTSTTLPLTSTPAAVTIPSCNPAITSLSTTHTPVSNNVLSTSNPVLPTTATNTTTVITPNSTCSVGPSFVTHNLTTTPPPATTVTPQLPLGLQVTPQTQANVLKAVYSYRLQQIQDFLASLPPSQKPTTTQELRELLIKNNVLSKALPADFLTQLQKMSPQISTEILPPASLSGATPTPSATSVGSIAEPSTIIKPIPTTTPAITTASKGLNITSSSNVSTVTPSTVSAKASSTSSITPTNSATPTSSSTSTQPNATLPGVTLETLKTLCRLPQADFVRIPMPAMLTTIVQFLRANKWTGNSSDLPGLLKQAQDALTKNAVSTTNVAVSSASPSVVQVTKLTTPQSTATKSKTTGTDSSPLSQLMASFGMKGTPTVNHVVTTLATTKQSSKTTNHLPITRQQSKAYQEQLEREKIANLQKILQSSEEARIAFRFKAHVDKLNQQLLTPDIKRPFTNWQDLILRLLPYHVYREPELPAGAMEKADAVYEGIAGVLLSRAQGLMSRYQQIVIDEQLESNEDRTVGMVMDRLWLDTEKEWKEEEEKQKREAEEIAAELSAVGGGTSDLLTDSMFDSDPFLLETDSYDEDPFLSYWT